MHKLTHTGHIHVISCGIAATLDDNILQYISHVDHIFASKALLSLYAQHFDPSKQQVHIIAAKARENARHALALCRKGEQIVVLASGDALYNGMGATLLSLRECEAITFHPHVTAFQVLFHKLALPWSDVALFSVHAQAHIPVRRIANEPFSVTYGGTNFPASSIAKAIIDFMPSAKNNLAVLAERLGTEDENIRINTLEALANTACHPTSILLTLPPSHYHYIQDKLPQDFLIPSALAANTAPILALGLPEDNYEREDNLITASDVRAVILARLRLPKWGVLWDLGAGSGSVGLEAAALCPHLKVFAVEKNEKRLAHMHANQKSMGVVNYHLHHGNALDLLQNTAQANKESAVKLLQPDRIFIGGGGADIAQLIKLSLDSLNPEGLLVVSAVTLESFHAIAQCAPAQRIALSSIQMAHEEKIAGRYHTLKNQNTIYIFTFSNKNNIE